MTVYVLQKDADKDFTPAKKFGKLEFVFPANRQVYPDAPDQHAEDMMQTAWEKLTDFKATQDYVLLNGDPVGIFIAGTVLSSNFNSIKALKWDKEHKAYYEVNITF